MNREIKDASQEYTELMGRTLAIVRETNTHLLHVSNILRVTINGYSEIVFVDDTKGAEAPLYITEHVAYYLASRFYIYDCGTFIAVYEDEPKDKKEQTAKEYAQQHNQKRISEANWRYLTILN